MPSHIPIYLIINTPKRTHLIFILGSPASSAVSIIPAKNRNVNFQIKNRTNVLTKQMFCIILSIGTNIRFRKAVRSWTGNIYVST